MIVPEPEPLRLELIDGMGPEPCRLVKPSPTPCRNDRHCAHHGSGPYICCKCGAEFVPIERSAEE